MKVNLAYLSGICLHLFAISISADQCLDGPDGTDCIFYDGLCAWKSELWKNSSEWKAALHTDANPSGSMESEELCSTNTDTHCLLFDYEFRFQRYNETTLSVLLHDDDTAKQTVWRSRSYDNGTYTAKVPLSTKNSFKIEFKAHRHGESEGVGSYVMIDKIWYNSSKCELKPEDADPGRKMKPTKPFTKKPNKTKTTTTVMTTTKLTKPSTIKPTPRITRTTATTTTTTTTRASSTSTKPSRTSSRTSEQKTHIMTGLEKMTSSTTSEKMSRSQQRFTSPNPMKGSGPTLSTPDSSNGYIVGTAISIFVLVVGIVVIIALLRHRRKACWQSCRSGADKTNATNVSLHNVESHLFIDSRADGTQGVSPPNPDTNIYNVVDDEQTNPSNNGQPSSPLQPQTDVYSVVHKPNKGGQSRHQSVNTADNKSKTTDNGAAAANNEEYNTLNMTGGETMGNTTKPGSSESAGAVYNHLGSTSKTAAVPSEKQPANTDTSQASRNDIDAANDSGAGIYHILEESEEDTTAKPSKMDEQDEEYRSLDFAGRKGGAASEAVSGEGEGEQVYNRLKDGDGETYSHVKRDVKQQVVSDDTYSHIV